jgi:hypothetical protein
MCSRSDDAVIIGVEPIRTRNNPVSGPVPIPKH